MMTVIKSQMPQPEKETDRLVDGRTERQEEENSLALGMSSPSGTIPGGNFHSFLLGVRRTDRLSL